MQSTILPKSIAQRENIDISVGTPVLGIGWDGWDMTGAELAAIEIDGIWVWVYGQVWSSCFHENTLSPLFAVKLKWKKLMYVCAKTNGDGTSTIRKRSRQNEGEEGLHLLAFYGISCDLAIGSKGVLHLHVLMLIGYIQLINIQKQKLGIPIANCCVELSGPVTRHWTFEFWTELQTEVLNTTSGVKICLDLEPKAPPSHFGGSSQFTNMQWSHGQLRQHNLPFVLVTFLNC